MCVSVERPHRIRANVKTFAKCHNHTCTAHVCTGWHAQTQTEKNWLLRVLLKRDLVLSFMLVSRPTADNFELLSKFVRCFFVFIHSFIWDASFCSRCYARYTVYVGRFVSCFGFLPQKRTFSFMQRGKKKRTTKRSNGEIGQALKVKSKIIFCHWVVNGNYLLFLGIKSCTLLISVLLCSKFTLLAAIQPACFMRINSRISLKQPLIALIYGKWNVWTLIYCPCRQKNNSFQKSNKNYTHSK